MALVLPGGGARGAYEAGALSVLLPLLEQRGEDPVIICGTSVGAINAGLLASLADENAAHRAATLVRAGRARGPLRGGAHRRCSTPRGRYWRGSWGPSC